MKSAGHHEHCGPAVDYPAEAAHVLFERRVGFDPNALAIVCGERRISYRHLDACGSRVAATLGQRGVGPGSFVGVCMDRSAEAIASIWGVLKTGAAYVPLDPRYPPEILRFIVQDAELSSVLTVSRYASLAGDNASEVIVLEDLFSPRGAEAPPKVSTPVDLDSPAFVGYTSGSTGTPKGVIHSHRHLVHRLYSASPAEVYCLTASLTFSFSLTRLFPPLMAGASLVLTSDEILQEPEALADLIEKEQVTALALVPSALRQLLEGSSGTIDRLRGLRSVTIAGAALVRDLQELFFNRIPGTKLFYGYGASETGPVTLREITSMETCDSKCVGLPLPNTQVMILDEKLNLLPEGVEGDIYVASRHLALGYLGKPELTTLRFLKNPFSTPASGDRMWSTGDRGRYLSEGRIEILGRSDDQVKVRGYRIELAQVEDTLSRHHGIREVAVVAREFQGDKRLVAFLVSSGADPPGIRQLREHLLSLVPHYMVPSAFFYLQSLPLNTTGKVDRSALPDPGTRRPELVTPYREPADEIESQVALLWANALGIDRVGRNDDFTELGGNSLAATIVVAGISERWKVDLSLAEFLGDATVATITALLKELLGSSS